MKSKLISLVLVCVLVGVMMLAIGCDEKPQNPTLEYPKVEEMPTNLPDYMGQIEWVDATAHSTSFDKNKSTIILVGGYSAYNKKYAFGLNTAEYKYDTTETEGGLSKNANQYFIENGTTELSAYWSKLGYNVGVFHYESFADDTLEAVNNKIYNSLDMRYKNEDGDLITYNNMLPDFNLTDLLVARWLEITEKYDVTGAISNSKPREVRFVGTSVGANLAVSATEYLNRMYGYGQIGAECLPTRVTLTNPYLSNSDFAINGAETVVTTALAKMESDISYLANLGTVFELLESDSEFFLSYEEPYSGVTSKEIIEDDDKDDDKEEPEIEYTLTDKGDAGVYNKIKNNVAYLTFNESYSKSFSEGYAKMDRAVLDWYLYSVVGSDDTNITTTSNVGYFNSRPMLDDRGYGSQAVSRYSVSAWTPTVYTRAQRGAEYVMLNRTYTSDSYVYQDYNLTKLASENYQVSDISGVQVVGYVYTKYAKADAVNFNKDNTFADFKVKVTVHISKTNIDFYATTDANGFYSLTIPEAYYGETTTIEFVTPNKNYGIADSVTTDMQNYMYMSMNKYVGSDTSIPISLSNAKYLIAVMNCGFVDLR